VNSGVNGKLVDHKKVKGLKDSFKPYTRHAIILGAGSPENWPPRVENSNGSQSPRNLKSSLSLVTNLIKRVKGNSTASTLMITCSSEPSSCEPGYHDVVVYPEAMIYRVAPSNLDRFVEILTSPTRVMVDVMDQKIFKTVKPPWDYLVAVCAHSTRDQRCGKIGPKVISKLQETIQDDDPTKVVKVIDTSHIGGHRFAGVLVVYPIADWYGLVTPSGDRISRVLQDVYDQNEEENCYQLCHRGRNVLVDW